MAIEAKIVRLMAQDLVNDYPVPPKSPRMSLDTSISRLAADARAQISIINGQNPGDPATACIQLRSDNLGIMACELIARDPVHQTTSLRLGKRTIIFS